MTTTSEEFKPTPAQMKAQGVLASGAVHIALGGGSRSGKTFWLVRAVIVRALKAPESRHAIFRFRFNSIKASVILDTLPKVMRTCFPEVTYDIDKTDWYMTLPNNSQVWFAGLDDKDRVEKVLGMEFATLYFNEASQIPWHSVVLAMTRLAQKTDKLALRSYTDFNPPHKKHWTYRRFVEKINPEDGRPEPRPEDFAFFVMNPMDNQENLDPGYLRMLEGLPEKARNRFLLGRFADDSEGALWTEELLAQNRVLGQTGALPDWLRVVVAVDPSGSKGAEDERSDEIGIVVAALGADSHGYVLEDLSGKYSPEEWGQIACEAYHRHAADRVVGETNYGGDMVRAIIQARDPTVAFTAVTASRGKVVRAEPIAALYEQNKIHHVGYFPQLEEQLCSFLQSGYAGLRSPDRGDACLVPGTLVTTRRGDIAIEQVTLRDEVLTRDGWFGLTWAGMTKANAPTYCVEFSDGSTLQATGEHPIWVPAVGWRRVDALVCGDIITHKRDTSTETCKSTTSKLSLTASVIAATREALTRASAAISSVLTTAATEPCIEMCGNTTTDRSPKVTTSTTATGTTTTTTSTTWSAFRLKSTVSGTPESRRVGSESTSPSTDIRRPSGIGLKPDTPGTRPMGRRYSGTETPSRWATVSGAGVRLYRRITGLSSVRSPATKKTGTITTGTMLKSIVRYAASLFGKTSTNKSQRRAPLFVVRVTESGESPVYNLHVDGPHEFFANGVLVHNCIWALTELFPGMTRQQSTQWRPPQVVDGGRSASRYQATGRGNHRRRRI